MRLIAKQFILKHTPKPKTINIIKKIFTQPALIDSCINILDYLKTNKLNWKTGYF